MFDDDERQRAIERMGVLDTPPDARVDRVTRLAQEIFDVPMVSVTLLDRERQWRKSQIGLGGNEAPREGAFCDATVRGTGTLVVEDASTDDVFASNPFVVGDPHLRFYAGHPLAAPGGEQVGTLCILDTQPRTLDQRQRELLRELAQWVQHELTREDELDQAVLVQKAVFTAESPTVPGYTLAASATPAGQLMGDMYDWYLHDGALRVTLADAMGKGTGAAIIAAGVRASLRTAPSRSILDAVTEVDEMLVEDIGGSNIFVTAVHAEIDTVSGSLSFVDAGHSLAFILRADGRFEALESTGVPLGMGFDEPRIVAREHLRVGDSYLVCSDGLLDILDADHPFEQVHRSLLEGGPEGAVAEAARLARVRSAPDDVTVVVVRRDA
jgi:hypothetical protein